MLLTILIAAPVILAAATTDRVYLPKPSGQYHVSKTQHIFNYTTLNDPLSPNNVSTYFVATILYPTEQAPTANTSLQYMTPELALEVEKDYKLPATALERLWTHNQWQAPVLNSTTFLPTLLFSPGAGYPCLGNTVMQSEMVSRGYTVLCIDHPGESPYLPIPYTNSSIFGLPLSYDWDDDLPLSFRVNDIRKSDFDALLQQFPALAEQFNGPFNTSAYLHFGFSMGGSVGTYLVSSYDSVLAGIDYDGAFIDTAANPNNTVDLKKPFLLLTRQVHPTAPVFFEKQTGWHETLLINGTGHLDFSDAGLLLDLLDLRDQAPEGLTGSINGWRMYEILTKFTTGFFDGVLGGKLELERDLPSVEWPEVAFVDGCTGKED